MVRRCVWGRCNTDERYRDRLIGVTLLPFPKPKTNLEKCLRWIKACGRPHEQLNVDKINGNRNKVVCSKHFVGVNGPTEQYPDPLPADGSKCTPSRPLPKKRYLSSDENGPVKKKLKYVPFKEITENNSATLVGTDHTYAGVGCGPVTAVHGETSTTESSVQTDEKWVSSLEVLTMTAEIESLKAKVEEQENTINELQQAANQTATSDNKWFGVQSVLNNKTNHTDLFKHYTGITYVRFVALLSFLIPENFSLQFEKGRSDLKSLSNEDGLFLTLTRCRRDFSLADLAMKFGLKLQTAGVVFNTWLDHMYFKLGQLPLWPHRDILINKMPKDFKKDYPTTLIIIDGTELFTQSPCALGLQSQFYSDYKGNTTLKGLIGCDSRGTLLFVSELFSGSVSDKVITEESGFYELLKNLKIQGYVQDGDSIMADKGFTIADELAKLNLNLNIPPFVRGGKQLTSGERKETQKIAKHRIHIERLIAKVKKNKILKSLIPTSMFSRINKIWTVCCHLTLFEDIFVKDKE